MGAFVTACILGALGIAAFALISWWRERKLVEKAERDLARQTYESAAKAEVLGEQLKTFRAEILRLEPWRDVANASAEAIRLRTEARSAIAQAEADSRILRESAEQHYKERLDAATEEASKTRTEARAEAKRLRQEAQSMLAAAHSRSARIVAEAGQRAEQIAGKAYDAVRNAERFEKTAAAMQNLIEGYGDRYLVPPHSVLDEIALALSHKEAGQQLKLAREHTVAMITSGTASRCEYVDGARREGAERFVLDAFNGRVDSVLSEVRHDNYGTLRQRILDAFAMVNHGGASFREARVTEEYLQARLDELRWACAAQELRRQELDEQRRIREQIREEERARREHDRAVRDAAKEEEAIQRAIAKARAQAEAASIEQKEKYESLITDLAAKLKDAEERGKRAVSMAQQTRRGHVYVISNMGSFGPDVYKIGLTRRLDPMDRIWELSDASVPFDFDVHAIIFSEDAPALEQALHKIMLLKQINKVNHRKEYFRTSIAEIRVELDKLGIQAKWTMTAEAREYRETRAIEKAIDADPSAREAWINRQLTLDPVAYTELAMAEP